MTFRRTYIIAEFNDRRKINEKKTPSFSVIAAASAPDERSSAMDIIYKYTYICVFYIVHERRAGEACGRKELCEGRDDTAFYSE